ncbi:hypothetical protein [Pseudoalteromonas sp. A757]|uniref:hypothetical protein n=1 Tax=Pseudoalteromonas sp. A757 TaxID=2250709 RepID=UPI000FFF0E3B|nr:hypothetical protein [Pseudoalteromonas sp. A757]
MELGHWDKAIIRSVFTTFIPIAGYFLVMGWLAENNNTDFVGYFFLILIILSVYLLFSVVGWCLIGFPVHWLASKYFNQSIWCYFIALVLFIVFVTGFVGVFGAAFYGLAAIVQAGLFLFWLRKLKT